MRKRQPIRERDEPSGQTTPYVMRNELYVQALHETLLQVSIRINERGVLDGTEVLLGDSALLVLFTGASLSPAFPPGVCDEEPSFPNFHLFLLTILYEGQFFGECHVGRGGWVGVKARKIEVGGG
jgi:hypothetical protein